MTNEKITNLHKLLRQLRSFSPITYYHSINVSLLCAKFGEYLGLDKEDINKLRLAGLLHDIGKLMVPESILHKPARLTEKEYEIIKDHPLNTIRILADFGMKNEEILDIIATHHERIDGMGYPFRLTGNEIPTLTKILSICDSYDAMRVREYYEHKDENFITNEFLNNQGTQFDSELTDLFLKYLQEKTIKYKKK